jgi:hypothetical protein
VRLGQHVVDSPAALRTLLDGEGALGWAAGAAAEQFDHVHPR